MKQSLAHLDKYRIKSGPWGSGDGDDFGAFQVPYRGEVLRIIASPGDAHEDIPWEHVSVSLRNRCPRWEEMCFVKGLFWNPDETVIQFHPPESDYVNNHRYCLHLWRPKNCEITTPPSIAVGYKELGILK